MKRPRLEPFENRTFKIGTKWLPNGSKTDFQKCFRMLFGLSSSVFEPQMYSQAQFWALLFQDTVGIWNPTIRNPETFEIWTFWKLYSKAQVFKYLKLMAIDLTIWKPDWMVQISNDQYKMAAILVGFQMVGRLEFKSHSKSRPFANQPLFDHSKSGHVRI